MTREEKQTILDKAVIAKKTLLETFSFAKEREKDDKEAISKWCHANLRTLTEFVIMHEKAKIDHDLDKLKETTAFLVGNPLMMVSLGVIAETIETED